MDILSIFRQYGVPFNDPCNSDYRGVCHCDQFFVEDLITQNLLSVCTNAFPAGTNLTNILQNICGTGGADDDWRFVSGSSVSDPVYRTGLTSIGTSASTHQLRVDGLFQFNPLTGWTFDFDNLFRFSYNTGAILSLASKDTPGTRTLLGDILFQGRYNGVYYTGASITAESNNPWTNLARDANLYFKTTETTTANVVMTLQSDARMRLNRYGLFNDGLPTTLLGLTGTLVSRHPITGATSNGSVLGISGGVLSWINPASSVIETLNGISKDSNGAVILGGVIDRNTLIQNSTHTVTIGHETALSDQAYIKQESDRLTLFVRDESTDSETELSMTPNIATIGFDRGVISARTEYYENGSAWLYANGTPIGIILTPGRMVLQGLPTYGSVGLAQADATLPTNGLFKVTGDNNLKIKI